MNTKTFSKKHYDENDEKGKTYLKNVMSLFGWKCIEDDEKKQKYDLKFVKNGREVKVEAEVRSDPKNNFDKIGRVFKSVHVPARKALKPNETADYFFSFKEDGSAFWRIKMDFAKKADIITVPCWKDGEEFKDDLYDVPIDKENVSKWKIEKQKLKRLI